MDFLQLNKLCFHAYHGVYEAERAQGTRFEVDLRLGCQLEKACQSDQLDDTIDYGKLYDCVAAEMQQPVNLIEHLAERICRSIRTHFPEIESVEIRLRKFHPPVAGQLESAEVILMR